MSIRQRQLTRVIEEIIDKEIRSGIYPEPPTIMHRLNEWLKDHVPGLPTLKLRPWGYRQTSSSEDFNKCMEEIHTDLHDIYAETHEQVERVLVNFDYADTERRKLFHQLAKLEDKIEELLLRTSNTAGYLMSYIDSFNDFSKVNMLATDAQVDLSASRVLLRELDGSIQKVNLRSATLSFNSELESKLLQRPQNAVDETLNTAWVERIVTNSSHAEPVIGELMVTLPPLCLLTRFPMMHLRQNPYRLPWRYHPMGPLMKRCPMLLENSGQDYLALPRHLNSSLQDYRYEV